MKPRHVAISLVVFALLAAACAPTPTSDPVSVIQAYHAAVNDKDAARAVALFADDGVLYDPFGAYAGPEQIRFRLAYLFDAGVTFEISNVQADGESVTWEQIVRENGEPIHTGPSHAIVRAGKIVSLGNAPELKPTLAATQLPAETTDPWGVVVVPKGSPILIAVADDPGTGFGAGVHLGAQLGAADFGKDIAPGFDLELVFIEDHATPGFTGLAEAVVADPRVVGIVGTLFSSTFMRQSEILEQAHVVSISPSSTAPEVTARGLATLNRTALNDTFQSRAAAEFVLKQLGFTTAAVIYDEGPYGRGLGEGFKAAFEAGGGTVVNFELRPAGQNEFGEILNRIALGRPQMIYYAGSPGPAAALAAQKNEAGLGDMSLMGADGILGQQYVELAGANSEGTYASLGSTPSGAGYEAFVEKYAAAGGAVGDIAYAPHAYDAVGILAQAIKSVATVNSAGHLEIGRQALANVVRATQGYAGLTGDITFDANGDRLSGAITIYQVQQGQWVQVSP